MAFNDLTFVYNGVTSEDIGVYLINMSTGLKESQFFGDRSLSFDLVPGNNTPYYYNQTISPFRVKLQIMPINGKWTNEVKGNVSRWLNNGKVNEFYSTDDINRRYFLTYIGSPSLHTTSMNDGYIEIEFQNIDCYVRSPVYEEIFDLSSTGYNKIEITNLGDTSMLPFITLQKIIAGDVSISNMSNGGQTMSFTGLSDNETLTIDAVNRQLFTDVPNVYRYDNFNGTYLSLPYGVNHLEVSGRCKLNIEYRYYFLSE